MATTIQAEIFIPISRIHPDLNQPRVEAGDVTELAASILENSLLQAILVRPHPSKGEGHYLIEGGERRWTACRLLGMTEMPARVRIQTEEDDAAQPLVNALVENLHRKDLNAVERAQAYGRLRDEYGLSAREIARRVGLTDTTVGQDLMLLELDDRSLERVRKKEVSVSEARDAIKKTRRIMRKKKGQQPQAPTWEPDQFTRHHHLARKAETMCEARGHTLRRRYGKDKGFAGACGACWETVIRQDEALATRAALLEELKEKGTLPGTTPSNPFLPPFLVPTTSGSTTNGTTS